MADPRIVFVLSGRRCKPQATGHSQVVLHDWVLDHPNIL